MPKNKRNSMRKKRRSSLAEFFMPTKWKILAVALLYFSNYVSFFGLIFNFPVYYAFYWGKPAPAGFEGLAIFVIHIAYLYVLSCVFIKLLSLD